MFDLKTKKNLAVPDLLQVNVNLQVNFFYYIKLHIVWPQKVISANHIVQVPLSLESYKSNFNNEEWHSKSVGHSHKSS